MSSTSETTHPYSSKPNSVGMTWLANEAIDSHHALHNRGELAVLLSVLDQAPAHLILEIGTWGGGAVWAFSHVSGVRKIITVDTNPQQWAPRELADVPCETRQILGDSTAPETIAKVEAELSGLRPDVVFIDGGHDYKTARADFENYGKLGRPGGLVIMHDTQGYPGNDLVQVPQLWAEIRQNYLTTEIVDLPGGPGGTGIIWL